MCYYAVRETLRAESLLAKCVVRGSPFVMTGAWVNTFQVPPLNVIRRTVGGRVNVDLTSLGARFMN